MKRIGNLFEAIVDRENLRLAFHRACRGKRDRLETRRFVAHLDRHLAELAEQLRAGTFPFGCFTQFTIRDPKERLITAPCFAERVAHHAIMAVCEPVLDTWLISDTYACRQGKGRVAALLRARRFAHRHTFYLILDIRKYFDSINHARLLALLQRRFKDRRVLDLFGQIVHSFRGDLGQGLPIGSLTSQHFANFYLGWFDRQCKDVWRMPGYVRYMDDMAIWSSKAAALRHHADRSAAWLREELGLELKPNPVRNRTAAGMDFLGCRVFPTHTILNRRSRVRFRRKLRIIDTALGQGDIGEDAAQRRATALVAFTRSAGVSSWRTRRGILESLEGAV